MNLLLLFAFLVLILVCYTLERKVKSFTVFIWPLVFVYIWIPLSLEEIGILKTFSSREIETPIALSVIFTSSYALCFFISAASIKTKVIGSSIFEVKPSRVVIFAGVLCIFLILVSFGIDLEAVLLSSWLDKSSLGFYAVLISWLLAALAGQFMLVLADRRYVLLIFILLAFVVVAVYFRSRSVLAILLLPFVIEGLRRKKLRIGAIFSVLGSLFVLAILLRFVRFQGALENVELAVLLTQLSSGLANELFSSGDLSVYRYFVRLTLDCGQGLSCGSFAYLQRFAEILGLAELNVSRLEYYMYDYYIEAGVRGSLHPTLFGYLYGDFGIFGGMLFMGFLGVLHVTMLNIPPKAYPLLIGFLSQYLLFLARGSVFNASIDLIAGLCVAFSLMVLMRFRKKQFET